MELLRAGEVKGLRWREDVDMVAKTITVNQQSERTVDRTGIAVLMAA